MMSGRYVAPLDEVQVREACRHTHPFWGSGRSLEEHIERGLLMLRTAGPELLTYAGWVNATGELVASLRRYSMLLSVPGPAGPRQVRTLGIGAVFTAESHRGQGAATRLLNAVLDDARASGEEASLLYSNIDPAFYTRLGFVEYPSVDVSAPVAALPGEGTLAVRAASESDASRLLEFYEASYPDDFLRPTRDPARWHFFRRHNARAEDLLLYDGPRLVGYLLAVAAGTVLNVQEWAAPDVEPPRLWATLRALAEAQGSEQIAGWLRRDQIDTRFTTARRDWGIPMVADLNGSLRLSAVDPERTHFSWIDHI